MKCNSGYEQAPKPISSALRQPRGLELPVTQPPWSRVSLDWENSLPTSHRKQGLAMLCCFIKGVFTKILLSYTSSWSAWWLSHRGSGREVEGECRKLDQIRDSWKKNLSSHFSVTQQSCLPENRDNSGDWKETQGVLTLRCLIFQFSSSTSRGNLYPSFQVSDTLLFMCHSVIDNCRSLLNENVEEEGRNQTFTIQAPPTYPCHVLFLRIVSRYTKSQLL